MYCEKCCIQFEGACCPVCGSKNIRMPQPRDYCFLVKKDAIWAGMLEDVLEQNKIPYTTESVQGAAMVIRTNPMNEEIRFYVPFGWYERAAELERALFDAEAMEDAVPEEEYDP